MTSKLVAGRVTYIDYSYFIVEYVVDNMPERVQVRREGSGVDSKDTFQFEQSALDRSVPASVDLAACLGDAPEVLELQRALRKAGIWTADEMAAKPGLVRDTMARVGLEGSHAALINQVKFAKTVNEEE